MRCDAPVDGLVLSGTRVTGVRLQGGEELPATRAIVTACGPTTVLNEWLRHASSRTDSTGDAHLREMLEVLGLESLLTPSEQAPGDVEELAEEEGRWMSTGLMPAKEP